MNEFKLNQAIEASVAKLKGSKRGNQVFQDFKNLMSNGGNGLDRESGHALCVLVLAAIKEGKREFLLQ